MTPEQFKALSPDSQEDFINSGGELVGVEVNPLNGVSDSPKQSSLCVVPTSAASTPTKFDGFDIANPYALLLLVDDDIKNGDVKCHDWQISFMQDFALGGQSDKHPFQAVVRAANGSGKDQFIVAACAVWLCMRYRYTICPITSASGQQLDTQTCRHIKNLAEKVNRWVKITFNTEADVWELKYREYACNFGAEVESKSCIYCFATDEPRKAEGYHPSVYGGRMGIFASEDKTIPDDINTALNKCTGYTHRVHVSTPGLPLGHFFDYCDIATMRDSIDSIEETEAEDWIQYHIPASRCSHLSPAYFRQMERDLPGGKLGAAYKSQVDAEFSTLDEMVVIPFTFVQRAQRWEKYNIEYIPEPYNTAGLDLSDGGDECVLAVRNGNKLLKVIPFRFENTQDTLNYLKECFKLEGLQHKEAYVFADMGGIGKPMLDSLKREGWSNIRYIDSRTRAKLPKTYLNRGTELWFNLRKLLEGDKIILGVHDDKLGKQLGGRKYKLRTDNVHQLLSKLEQKSKGYHSPDRADAVNLCFWNYEAPIIDEEVDIDKPFEEKKEEKVTGHFDLRRYANGSARTMDEALKSPEHKRLDFSFFEEEIFEHNSKILTRKE